MVRDGSNRNPGAHGGLDLMLRRDALKTLIAAAALPRAAFAQDAEPGLQLGAPHPFAQQDVIERARLMAQSAYEPRAAVPQGWLDLDYDQYRAIWFDARNALWEGTETPLRLDVFPPGLYFPRPIQIYSVDHGLAQRVQFDLNVFDRTDQFPDLGADGVQGYSGLRLRAELEQPGIFTEFAVFQGASYFRGIGTGQIYGLSARGLAIDTAEPSGEEFPEFTTFWIERPAPDRDDVVIHALMDTPSCTGAYRFHIRPGTDLVMDVEAQIFARTEMTHIGLGALTSMFLFDETIRDRFSDFRAAVHDSDGLLIRNGAGETLWRPLANPKALQVSAFTDNAPVGFGLMQRERRFSDFADLEALYHRRPSLWIEPLSDWGQGAVTLVEIPTDLEFYDNIVTYWRPAEPLAAGGALGFEYRMTWGHEPEVANRPLRVLNTRIGGRPEGGLIVAIDFEAAPGVPEDLSQIERLIRSSQGEVSSGVVQRNPDTGGPRLAFTFTPGATQLAEFRVQLRLNGEPLSEVWLYRWTA
jgi:glucans biosynthesis protein